MYVHVFPCGNVTRRDPDPYAVFDDVVILGDIDQGQLVSQGDVAPQPHADRQGAVEISALNRACRQVSDRDRDRVTGRDTDTDRVAIPDRGPRPRPDDGSINP